MSGANTALRFGQILAWDDVSGQTGKNLTAGGPVCSGTSVAEAGLYNADERAFYFGIEFDARRTVGERLRGCATADGARAVADDAYEATEDLIRDLHTQAPPPVRLACRAGCAWCCHLTVEVTAAEALRIADYLRETLSETALDAVKARLAALGDRIRGMDRDERAAQRLPCALLVDNLCSAYPVRPLKCRGGNAFDAGACERYYRRPERESQMPIYVLQYLAAEHVQTGLLFGLADAGMAPEALTLTAALRIALETPDAAERWLAGKPVFAEARVRD